MTTPDGRNRIGGTSDWLDALVWCPPDDETPRDRPKRGPAAEADRPSVAVLSAQHITKSFRRRWGGQTRKVLSDASLELLPGEIVGLVGENGSGKSTLMKILVGSLRRDGGTLSAIGSIGYCPQEPVLYERLTCDEHFDLFGHAYGLDSSEADRSASEIYELLAFEQYRKTRVEDLSGGSRAKLNLGLALLPDPDLLLLDEPYAGFDWDTYLRFWDLTSERRAAGRSVLIISHFVGDQERFDRIIHLRSGKTTTDDHIPTD